MSTNYYNGAGKTADGTLIESYNPDGFTQTNLSLDGLTVNAKVAGTSELTVSANTVTVNHNGVVSGNLAVTGNLAITGNFGSWIALPYRTVSTVKQWDNAGSTFSPGRYRLVGDMVEIEGKVAAQVVVTAPDIIATLPSGYRPTKIKSFVVYTNAGIGYIEIGTTGVITLQAGGVAGVVLDGAVRFSLL